MSDRSLATTAIVTVSYNSSARLAPFLASIRAQAPDDLLVIVADNGSSDVAATAALCHDHGARLLALGENFGYGGAINRAIATMPSTVDRILISNPDVVFAPGAISELVSAIDEFPRAGAIGPRVLNDDGTVYPSARRLPSLRTGVGHALFSRIWPDNPWTAAYLSDASASDTGATTGWLSGSCLIVRRAAFESIGGFDDAFFMYFEDVDLGFRLGKAGWSSYYEPRAIVTHTGAHSTSTDPRKMVAAHHRSAYRYVSRKYSAWYLFPVRWALGLGLAIRSRWLQRG